MTDKPKRKHNPAWSDPPENVARRNREKRARDKALLLRLVAALGKFGHTITSFVDGVEDGSVDVVSKENKS